MHSAPSVSYPVGRCAFQGQLYVFFTLVTSAVWLAWTLDQGLTWQGVLAGCFAAVGVWGGWQARDQRGTLTWSGQVWCLHDPTRASDDALGQVRVVLDVQKALLLRWLPASDTLHAQPKWLWLGAQTPDDSWQDLRCAVYQPSDMD